MKIQIEVDGKIEENIVVVKCNELNSEVLELQRILTDVLTHRKQITFYKGDIDYYLSLDEILFFETVVNGISAHTINNVYQVKYKLYELVELLPSRFLRVSKSTILNTDCIYSITRNLTASSIVEFQNTHKKVYVSRNYYKLLKTKLEEMRKG